MLFSRVIRIGVVGVALFTGTVFASVAQTQAVRHEKRSISLDAYAWTRKSAAPGDTILPLRIALASPTAEDLGHEKLMDVSDPTSPNFGKHWTPRQVSEFFAPSPAAVRSVQNWLSSSGLARSRQEVGPSRASISVNATVSEAESLLHTKYHVWERDGDDDQASATSISCDEYYVPESLQQYISFISPTVNLHYLTYPSPATEHAAGGQRHRKRESGFSHGIHGPIRVKVKEGANLTDCSDAVTPDCVKALYGIPPPTIAVEGNDMGVFESGDVYDQQSLDQFFTTFASDIPNGTHPLLQSIDGGTAPAPNVYYGGAESALDFELVFPLVYPQTVKLFQTLPTTEAASGSVSFFNAFLDALDSSYCGGDDPQYDPVYPDEYWSGTNACGVYAPTNVISFSYALSEATYSPAYERRICAEYLKLGLMGTSIIYASGDNGTLSRAGVGGCLADGAQNPSFPASCPVRAL